jgi:hypothetical protein
MKGLAMEDFGIFSRFGMFYQGKSGNPANKWVNVAPRDYYGSYE